MAPRRRRGQPTQIESLKHHDTRKNIPTEELRGFVPDEPDDVPNTLRWPRDPALDPQLVWQGKDQLDGEDLAVPVVPIYIQEKLHPHAIIEDLRRASADGAEQQLDMFDDFNGIDDLQRKLEFYQHDQNWSNRLILGDSLLVMASLAEKEGLRGKVQCIYLDPPYGIKFGSNWQVSTRKRNVTDGRPEDATRQPEQVRAFRDTWVLGVHSYLTYLRDRLTLARDLLNDTGSIFVQIGDDNVHRVRAVMDEVFGDDNFMAMIYFQTAANQNTNRIQRLFDCILWYKKGDFCKYHEIYRERSDLEIDNVFTAVDPISGERYKPTQIKNMAHFERISKAGRIDPSGKYWKRKVSDYPFVRNHTVWTGTIESTFSKDKIYVVQTNKNVIQRCILMSTDPGDLVLDPTCGSGTTAYVAEQWGRRWITIDTARVALTLARTRLVSARFPFYMLTDSSEGLQQEARVGGETAIGRSFSGDIRQGFVSRRVPRVTLGDITNNEEIDAIWDEWLPKITDALVDLSAALHKSTANRGEEAYRMVEEEVPCKLPSHWPPSVRKSLERFWQVHASRQRAIDASISRSAQIEVIYDQPYEESTKVRVTGPFTVESLSPHRMLASDDSHPASVLEAVEDPNQPDFTATIIDHLAKAGVQNTKRSERLVFVCLEPLAGDPYLHASGEFADEDGEIRRVAVFIGPEHGTVGADHIGRAARAAVRGAGYDLLVVCGFAFDAHADEKAREFAPRSGDAGAEFQATSERSFAVAEAEPQYGRLPVMLARMNPDLSIGDELLKNTGAGNLFTVFGEPDVRIERTDDCQLVVELHGVDVYDPTSGDVRSSSTDDIACWFIDTQYDEQSFFVRHAYFTGEGDPYQQLKRALRAEIDPDAWASLYQTRSRPFPPPTTGRIAVKVINHYGDEVLKVYEISER